MTSNEANSRDSRAQAHGLRIVVLGCALALSVLGRASANEAAETPPHAATVESVRAHSRLVNRDQQSNSQAGRVIPVGQQILDIMATIRQRWPARIECRGFIRRKMRELRELRSQV